MFSKELRGLIVTLHLSAYRGAKVAREATEEVQQGHRAQRGSTTVTKHTIPKKYLDPILSIQSNIRYVFHQMTLPWDNSGARLLPPNRVMAFRAAMEACRTELERAVRDFTLAYPTILYEAREWLGDLYDPGDFPAEQEIRGLYAMHISVLPMPEPEHLTGLGKWIADDVIGELQEEAEGLIDARLVGAQSHLRERLVAAMLEFADTLTTKKRFRAPSLEKLEELATLAPSMSVLDDDALASVCRQLLTTLTYTDVDDLRANEDSRAVLAFDLTELAKQLQQGGSDVPDGAGPDGRLVGLPVRPATGGGDDHGY